MLTGMFLPSLATSYDTSLYSFFVVYLANDSEVECWRISFGCTRIRLKIPSSTAVVA